MPPAQRTSAAQRAGPGRSGRVAVVSIEGIGASDVSNLAAVRGIGRFDASPRVAYGLIRRRLPPGTDLAWAESMTGRLVAQLPEFNLTEHTTLWDVARSGGVQVLVFARSQATASLVGPPETTGEDTVDSVVRDDRDRVDGALAAWRERSAALVVLRVEGVILDELQGRPVRASSRALLERCLAGFIDGVGPDGTVILFSSAALRRVDSPADEEPEQPLTEPGLVLVAGRGAGGKSWPAIARLADVMPMALFLLGLSPPPKTQGTVLHDLLDLSFLFHQTVERPPVSQAGGDAR